MPKLPNTAERHNRAGDAPKTAAVGDASVVEVRGELHLMGKTMIVDDDEDMRVLLRVLINGEDQGLRVVGEATSGEEAIALRPDVSPDVVVLDFRMPGLDGLDTAQRLLADAPDLPIILYTAH